MTHAASTQWASRVSRRCRSAAVLVALLPAAALAQIGSTQSALMGGAAVPPGELSGVGRLPGCTATLIAPQVVLTAAHCVCPSQTSAAGCSARSTFTLVDVRPVDDPATADDESTVWSDVSIGGAVHVHPEYTQQGWLRKDLAVIVLDRPVYEVAVGVEPLQLAGPGTQLDAGDRLTLIGFGRTDANCVSAADYKQRIALDVDAVVPDAITVGNPSGYACPGDSGGPAIDADEVVVGVASWTNFGDQSTYRPTWESHAWITGIRDSWNLGAEPEGAWASAGASADLDAHRPPYQYTASGTIIEMAIAGSDDHVYAWHADGTVTSGTSADLDAYRAPYAYTLPPGQTPNDIVGVGIAGSNDRVYVWYADGTVSSGTTSDLDAHVAPRPFSLPPGKTPGDIVGMGIAGSNDHVYAWYRDGTVSAGTSTDLDAYHAPYAYTLPAHKSPGDIVGMAIAGSNDWVYAWYAYVLR